MGSHARSALAITTLLLLAGTAHAAFSANRTYTVGNFAFSLGSSPPGYVRSVKGGTMVADVVAEGGTRGAFPWKRPAAPRFDPLVFEVTPADVPKPMWDWINSGAASAPATSSASLVGYNMNLTETSRRVFRNARVSEVTTCAFDGRAKDPCFFAITTQADGVTFAAPSGARAAISPQKATQSLAANFRMTLPGLDTTKIARISPITVRYGSKPEVMGFSVFVGESFADPWRKWHETSTLAGRADEKDGAIELLSPTLKDVVSRVRLEGVGVLSVDAAETKGNEAAAQTEIELYAESVRFEAGP